ncbi:MAG: MBL fold metallo-hydrolase, partial [Clostridiales bacterium]|nr:MBL fold metallo-hydrolase [Clostridiales bacterium]
MARRANIIPIDDWVTLIDDAGESTCYLVTGTRRALLIDTLNGAEDLAQIVRERTALPVTVVDTHGHLDHIYGNVFFDEAYLHPADWPLHDRHFALPPGRALRERTGREPCRLLPLSDGQIFDLGGATLEVIHIPGHTPGSVALLFRERRLLFTGDGVNGHLWMQLPESTPLGTLRQSLMRLLGEYRGAFDHILTGHAVGLEDGAIAEWLLSAVDGMLAGDSALDRPYPWFQGVDRCHPFGPDNRYLVAYRQAELDIERGVRPPYPPARRIASNPALDGLVDVRPDVVYSTATGKELKLALLTPWNAKERDTPLPAVVFVQGSAWTSPDVGYQLAQLAGLSRRGIAVASITHRSCLDGHPFPAFLQDVKAAIRFLRENAAQWNLDPARVGIWGTSSGGNAALLAGLTGDDPRYRTAEHADQSDAVKAVVECFGPTDLTALLGGRIEQDTPFTDIFRGLVGERDAGEVLAEMSPVSHVRKDAAYPPFLLIQGDADDVVPYEQMAIMHRRLIDQGADA